MDTKPWYSSKVIWASIIGGLVTLLGLFNIDVSDMSTQLVDTCVQVVGIIAFIVALYGRITTKSVIAPGPSTDSDSKRIR